MHVCGVSSYRMKLMRDNEVVTGAYVTRGANDMPDFAPEEMVLRPTERDNPVLRCHIVSLCVGIREA